MITERVTRIFKKYITGAAGIQTHRNDKIAKAVSRRMKECKFNTPQKYLKYLKYHPQGSVELRHLLTLVTINESYFFRGPYQFKALREKILPQVCRRKLKKGSRPNLSIWSAGCSTGEEPYSIAIEVLERVPFPEKWEIEILGTDVDKVVLNRALKATYNSWSLRDVSEKRKQRYFNRKGEQFKLKSRVKKLCSFDYHNLMEKKYPHSFCGKWDIIFCRNVFIYFDTDIIKKVLKNFAGIISDEGYLFPGNTESLYKISEDFDPLHLDDAIIYKRKAPEEKKQIPKEEPPKEPSEINLPPDVDDYYSSAYEYYIKELYDKATEELEKYLEYKDTFKGCILAAKIYSEQNNLSKALEYALEAIEKNKLDFSAYFIAGDINYKMKNMDAAQKYFKNTLYLKDDFGLANFKMAQVYEERGALKKAIREYKNALLSFRDYPEEEPIELAGGFTPKTLVSFADEKVKQLENVASTRT